MAIPEPSPPALGVVRVYGIPNCDSVKKARQWLAARALPEQFHDFKKAGVPPERLDAWLQEAGWQRVLNRQGSTWRRLPPAQQALVQDTAGARALMLAQPSVIKRPVMEWPDGAITVGLDALASR